MSRKTRQPKLTDEKWPRKANRLRNVQMGDEFRLAFWQCCCVSSTEAKEPVDTKQLRLHFIRWSGERKVWDLKSSISPGTRSCRIRSSSWNRNVPAVVFRFWHAQLKNWSNTKSCTERNVAGQTRLHKRTSMRAIILSSRIVKVPALLVVIISTRSLRHATSPGHHGYPYGSQYRARS